MTVRERETGSSGPSGPAVERPLKLRLLMEPRISVSGC
jgi:hypothetical protein